MQALDRRQFLGTAGIAATRLGLFGSIGPLNTIARTVRCGWLLKQGHSS
jgi:hypothetical protein